MPRWIVLGVLVASLPLSSGSAEIPANPPREWTEVMRITRPHAEVEALTEVLRQVEGAGYKGGTVGHVLKKLTDFIDSEVASHGSVMLNVGMLVDAIEAVESAKWPPDQAAHFVVALQRDMNAEHRDEESRLHGAISAVRRGGHFEQLVDEMGELKPAKTVH
jgi:hypothetical protein